MDKFDAFSYAVTGRPLPAGLSTALLNMQSIELVQLQQRLTKHFVYVNTAPLNSISNN